MSEKTFEKIKELLVGKNYHVYHHEKVQTSKEAAEVRGTKLEEATKALVMIGEKPIMVIVAGHRRVDYKKLKKMLRTKKIKLAEPDHVLEITDCEIGSVPPFGNLFELPVYVDISVNNEYIVFSAGTHYDSIRMKRNDFLTIVKPSIGDFGKD